MIYNNNKQKFLSLKILCKKDECLLEISISSPRILQKRLCVGLSKRSFDAKMAISDQFDESCLNLYLIVREIINYVALF